MSTQILSINQGNQKPVFAYTQSQNSGQSTPQLGNILPASKVEHSDESVEKLQRQDLEKITENLNKYAALRDLTLQFSLDDDSGRTVIKVINKDTNEVVRQFPPDEILYLSKTINSELDSFDDNNTGFLLELDA